MIYYTPPRKEKVKTIVCEENNRRLGLARDYRANNRMNEQYTSSTLSKKDHFRERQFCVETFADTENPSVC
jgi:hypothetical protein